MSNNEINPRYTRSQARAKSQAMDDGIEPEESISQVSKEYSTRMTGSHESSTCRTTHSASSHGSGRSREQLNLDISALVIKMNSQERRAQLKRNKLEINLDIEQNELKEQMDLAKNEREVLYENQNQDQGSSSSSHVDATSTAARAPEQERRFRNHPSNPDINKMLDEYYTFLGSGKIDGAKACRVYCPSTTSANQVKKKQTVKTNSSQKSIEPEKATRESQKNPERILASTSKAPVISKRSTLEVPRTSTSKTFENDALAIKGDSEKLALQKEEIGYFPLPTYKAKTVDREKECTGYELPDRTLDKALEALYRQQTIMMGALQAPKIGLLEFHGDTMSYHSFTKLRRKCGEDGA